MDKEGFVSLFLRIGLAFTFAYAGFAALGNPENWIGFIPGFVESIISRNSFLVIHSVFNISLGFWLLSGWKSFYSSIVAAVFFFGVAVFNLGALEIVFRDIGLLFAAIALAGLSKK